MIAPPLPRDLKRLNIYVDGIPYREKCEKVTLPSLKFVFEYFRGGGMDAPIPIEMGMEPLTLSMTIADCSKELLDALSKYDIGISLRGTMQVRGTSEEGVAISIRGCCTGCKGSYDFNKPTTVIDYRLHYFKYVQNDKEIVEIDGPNMVRKFNGVDQLAEYRELLGL
ncbi:phage major tail tube protein [Bartonella schoenbuchensis]|uniref:Phage tail tube protein n=2 Tax=Bartonella schoenbuchensis TaxID=165694 RepID=E6YYV6_BARSR|nr:phage major tail tube protein [Bartonella schoenbuchensis]AQX30581.1 hypothetical protein BscR1v2_006410 [Bartonella schoenbuchensis R1]CBI82117.1 Phage tail tube protein [Bartonella schoenbuchensis R1]CDP80052.1 phage tail tube protein FII [Bartonella schoenbuchensis]CDP80054.1 phage tail tube protein FII [Bartonella schoenbuchensis]CDP80337.1 phage tail tube protein FII [Bartonella schoenbuchensis]